MRWPIQLFKALPPLARLAPLWERLAQRVPPAQLVPPVRMAEKAQLARPARLAQMESPAPQAQA